MIYFKPIKITLKHIGNDVYQYVCNDKELDSTNGNFFTVTGLKVTQETRKTKATYWQPEEYDESDPEIEIYNPISFDIESGDEIEFNEKELKEAIIEAIQII